MANLEIACPACGAEALLRREPVYDGFRKTGERLLCSACGHAFESEDAVPFVHRAQARVFTEADKSRVVDVFAENEKQRNCRYCANYTVNPFTQWCSRHRREVAATDTCDVFTPKLPEPPKAPPVAKPPCLL